MNKNDIEEFINDNKNEAYFTGGIDNIKIKDIEKQLKGRRILGENLSTLRVMYSIKEGLNLKG